MTIQMRTCFMPDAHVEASASVPVACSNFGVSGKAQTQCVQVSVNSGSYQAPSSVCVVCVCVW